jgi:hypothetical protein
MATFKLAASLTLLAVAPLSGRAPSFAFWSRE